MKITYGGLLALSLTATAMASDATDWVNITNLGNKGTYNAMTANKDVSGMLPAGWQDNSAWSGAKVTYSFQSDHNINFWRIKAEKEEGMAQFYFSQIPPLQEKKYFRLHVKARSAAATPVIFGLRASADPFNYYCFTKITLSQNWQDYTIPFSGGPADVKPVLFIEFFSPGQLDMASIKIDTIPEAAYLPLTAVGKIGTEDSWMERHQQLIDQAAKSKPDVIIMGDSLTQRWEKAGAEVWKKNLKPLKAANFGIDGDRVENLLWRIRNSGIGQDFSPRVIAILIGINNIDSSPEDIAIGMKSCLKELHAMAPAAKILLIGVFPAGKNADDSMSKQATEINRLYQAMADNKNIFFIDIGKEFLAPDNTIAEAIMPDSLHLSPKGYEIYADKLVPELKKLLAQPSVGK